MQSLPTRTLTSEYQKKKVVKKMYTTYLKGSKEIPYIPAKIVTAEPQLGVHINGNLVYCGNWRGYEFAMVGDSYELIFQWVIYDMKGFKFKTHHSLDAGLLDLLEYCRAIRRFDGKADLIQMANFEYSITFRECDSGFVVDRIEPQDESYPINIKAFYDEAVVLADLIKQSFTFNMMHDFQNRISLEFENGTGDEIFYADYLPIERLIEETFKYQMCTDTYILDVVVGAISRVGTKILNENYLYLTIISRKNVYRVRIKIDDFLFSQLARIGVLKVEEGYSGIDLDVLYKARLKIVFRRMGSEYKFFTLKFESRDEDEYWQYLLRLAEEERENNEE